MFDNFFFLGFTLQILAKHESGDMTLTCGNSLNCHVYYQRSFTPALHYISPRVVYNEAYTDYWFDPRSTTWLIKDLTSDEMPFINGRISKALVDFEFNVDDTTTFSWWAKNHVRGQVGELPIGHHNISMMWETGLAHVMDHYATVCMIDNTTCYKAKNVPVIFSMSSNTGSTNGG